MSVGFIHGVMNTDNMPISRRNHRLRSRARSWMSTTRDTVFSSIDRRGRYSHSQTSQESHSGTWRGWRGSGGCRRSTGIPSRRWMRPAPSSNLPRRSMHSTAHLPQDRPHQQRRRRCAARRGPAAGHARGCGGFHVHVPAARRCTGRMASTVARLADTKALTPACRMARCAGANLCPRATPCGHAPGEPCLHPAQPPARKPRSMQPSPP